MISMENIYAIIKKGSSLKKYCYKNGYKLEEVISVKNMESSKILKILAKHGIDFSDRKETYKTCYIKVSRGNRRSRLIGYFLNLFTEESSVSIKIKDSFYRGTEMPFSF